MKLKKLQPKYWKLRDRLVFFFSIIVIVPIGLIILINYNSQVSELKKNVANYAEILMHQATSNIDYYITDANELINAAFLNPYISEQLEVVKSDSYNEYEKVVAEENIRDQFYSIARTKEYINNYYLVDMDAKAYSSLNYLDMDVLMEREWFRKVFEGNLKKTYQYVADVKEYLGDVSFGYTEGAGLVILMQYLNREKNHQVGVIGIEIKFDVISEIMNNINEFSDSAAIMLDDQRVVIQQSSLGVKLKPEELDYIYNNKQGSLVNKDRLIVFDTLTIQGWKLVQVNSLSQLLQNSRNTSRMTILVGVVFVIIAEIFAFYIAWQVTRPISGLMLQMKSVETGVFDTVTPLNEYDDIGLLSIRFNKMVRRLDELIMQIQQDEQEKRVIEMQLLHEQINPHFLYNTLNSLVWLSRIQKTPTMTEGLKSLIHILKNTIHSGSEMITITEEIEFIKNYIVIQKLRFGDKFNVNYQVADYVKDLKILKLLIQPIIENAIIHGIRHEEFDNIININIARMGEFLEISIKDNGVGMNQEEIEALKIGKNDYIDGMNHIGLNNIIQRIKLHYGDEYSLDIKSDIGIGTTVFVKLPIIS